jgi:hypothetical protein
VSRTSSTASDTSLAAAARLCIVRGGAAARRRLDARRRGDGLLAAAAIALTLAGCASAPRVDTGAIEPIELVDVPFFPQTKYQCGPAALATILAYEGLPVDADDLAPAVYVEGLHGSLQAELLGATRRHGLVPYPIDPDVATLFEEVASGKPVLVLQNLGLKRVPIWHYAVVVGFDASRDRVLLRSGTEHRRSERIGRFQRSWRLADHWAFVATEPADLPTTASPAGYVRALAGAESLLEPSAVDAAYEAILERWPDEPLALFAAAGRHAAAQRWNAAAAAYASLLEIDPGHAAARNNLAHVLAGQGCRQEALRQARAALGSTDASSPLRVAIEDTVETLATARPDGDEPEHCQA